MSTYPSLEQIFRKGKELALYDGELWGELSGLERNRYYARAERSLIEAPEEMTAKPAEGPAAKEGK